LLLFLDFVRTLQGMKTPRIGRPPKSGDKTMTDRLEVRLEPGEKAAYDKAADLAGMERSDWIRAVLNDAAAKVLRGKR
jgi:uncharacterized protein (DUF1778 family)